MSNGSLITEYVELVKIQALGFLKGKTNACSAYFLTLHYEYTIILKSILYNKIFI